jgi:hypothetical protein
MLIDFAIFPLPVPTAAAELEHPTSGRRGECSATVLWPKITDLGQNILAFKLIF